MNGQNLKPLFEDSSASPELRSFVAMARSDGPGQADLNRLAARLGPALGVSAAALLANSAVSAGALGTPPAELLVALQPAAALKLGVFGKLLASGSSKLLAVGLSAGVGVGVWAYATSQSPAAPTGQVARRASAPVARPEEPVQAPTAVRGSSQEHGPSQEVAAPLPSELGEPAGRRSSASARETPGASAVLERGAASARGRRGAVGNVSAEVNHTATEPLGNPAAAAELPSELSLIQQAEAARARGAEALALLATHERLYPRGALAQEREVLAIELLLKAGKLAQAAARASRFDHSYPHSAHLPRVRALLERARGE